MRELKSLQKKARNEEIYSLYMQGRCQLDLGVIYDLHPTTILIICNKLAKQKGELDLYKKEANKHFSQNLKDMKKRTYTL